MKIGILGGTFDPIHHGHLIIAQEAQERLQLSKVIFIPAFVPPHKTVAKLADSRHRMEMVSLALSNHPCFEVTDMEIRRGGNSYSIDTVEEISSLYPRSDIFFLIGMDTLLELSTWKEIHRLLQAATFITLARPGQKRSELSALGKSFNKKEREKLEQGILEGPLIDISSTMIREKIQEGKSIRYLVPDAVEKFIQERGLYE